MNVENQLKQFTDQVDSYIQIKDNRIKMLNRIIDQKLIQNPQIFNKYKVPIYWSVAFKVHLLKYNLPEKEIIFDKILDVAFGNNMGIKYGNKTEIETLKKELKILEIKTLINHG